MNFARVPPELLDEIVGYLSDRTTLKRLALTNRWFHHLSRPLLFTSFKFHPYSLVAYTEGECAEDLVRPQAEELEHARGRLGFWASEEIAPYVLKCHVEPLDFIGGPRPGQDPYTLLAAFFALLPRFVNLQHFGGFYVHFTRVAMTNLCALPKLRSVNIDSCVVADNETFLFHAPLAKLDDFTFRNNADDMEEWWFRACPHTLRVLCVDINGLQNTLGTLLLPLSGLHRLTIDRCFSNIFLAAIHSVSRANSIEYLEISLLKFVLSLGSFGEIFPNLKTLFLTLDGRRFSQVADDDVALSTLLHDLPSSLPPNIAKVALNWEFEHKVQPPNLAQVKDDIVSQRPMLKTLWVHCTDFVYVWSETPDGQQHTISGGREVAAKLLPVFEKVFYGPPTEWPASPGSASCYVTSAPSESELK
ncbi:hypothetical protein DFH09DRAFT_1188604 [Mycena vulgaris]|nr:hypothetical protein DFH09DRAFT_1188604 [Mycena vulgaris]